MVEINFKDHANVLLVIQETQDAEEDGRSKVQIQKTFILDTMWDDNTTRMMKDRYLGEFDQISPINDQITGEMTNSEFSISVSPAGGGATEDTADTYAGLMRNIENISSASNTYSQIGDSVVMAGLDGLEVVQKHVDANTFDQDLMFEYIEDWYKSVWFDLNAIKQDKSDSSWAIKLREMPISNYKKDFPKGGAISIGSGIQSNLRNQNGTPQTVTVGKLYYKKPVTIPLVQMTSGAVYEKDEKFLSIQDELAQAGELIAKERDRKSWRVWSRLLDGGGWLNEEEETVFSYIPLIPALGNYSRFDGKDVYSGKTFKLMDEQRGINFAASAFTEDVAMTPTDAVWMTKQQGQGEDYSKMNIDRKAVRYYTADPEVQAPFKMPRDGGNPAMQNALTTYMTLLTKTGNMDDPSMGQNPNLQSGIAVNSIIDQSNNGNVKWFKAMEIMIGHACRVCIDAIPRVYSATRQQRILAEDGTSKIVGLNTNVFDEQTQRNVSINDLSKGTYDVTCSMGATFQNQQEKESQRLLDMIAVDPAALEMGRDQFYKNQVGATSQILSDRFRKVGIENGTIGEDEWTEEEAAEIQQAQTEAAQQPPQEDPLALAAQAEMVKGQADMQNAQNKQAEIQGNQQISVAQIQLDQEKLQFEVQKFVKGQDDKFNVDAAKIQQGQQALDMRAQKEQFELVLKQQAQQQQEINDAINNLKVLREAMGVDAIVGDTNTQAYKNQADIVIDEQDDS